MRHLHLFLLLILLLAACGGRNEPPAPSQAPTDAPVEEDSATEKSTELTTEESAGTTTEGATGGVYTLVETGQGICYNADGEKIECPAEGEAFYGQDAQFTAAAFNYADNGNGTITDNVTGLMWEQRSDTTARGWADAQSYCEDLSLASYDDWRTPSLTELFSISDFGSGWPYIDMNYFDLITENGQDKLEQYWANNYYVAGVANGMQSAFGVNHATGHIKAYPDGADGGQRSGKYVRCVRGDEYLVNDFVDNGNGTITDHATGLMWLQDDSGEGIDWEAALAYANDFSFAGYDDWRVPNVKELQTIVDYSGLYPAIDPTYFNITDEDAYFWTSTSAYFSPNTPGYYYGWYVAFGYALDGEGNDSHGAGAVRFDTKAEGGPAGEEPERVYNYVRLVRGGNVIETPEGDPMADDSVEFVDKGDGTAPTGAPPGGAPPEGTGNSQMPDFAAAAATLGITEQALRDALGGPPPDFAAAAATLGISEQELQEALGDG